MARQHEPLQEVRLQACASATGGLEWLLDFRLLDPVPPRTRLRALLVVGVKPAALLAVQVQQHGQMLFEITSQTDGRGRACSAGDILLGMATMAGHTGLRLDAADMNPTPAPTPGLSVSLRLQVRDAESPRQIDVLAELDVAWCPPAD